MGDSGNFSIRVVDEDGDGVEGVEVSCQYGIVAGVDSEYTDSDGWAQFDIVERVISGDAKSIRKIWINGQEVSDREFYPEDGDTFSFTLP